VTVIDVPNPDLRLKPGMTANVTVEIARATDVLRVPNSALRVHPSGEVLAALGQRANDRDDEIATSGDHTPREAGKTRGEVWISHGGMLDRIPVSVGISDGTRTAVFSRTLTEGAQVVTSVSGDAAVAPAPSRSPLLPAFRGRGSGNRGGNTPPPGR
jgi:HlyD family secretion protein